jgi:type IV pilus assembly protein PilE
MPKPSGFTLIEVMITVAIISILATIALPSYTSYLTRGRIPDATAQLAAKRVRMEQFFQDNRTYVGAAAGAPDSTSSAFFDFSALDDNGLETRTATGYTLYARGKGPMTGFTYSIDAANARTTMITGVSGWATQSAVGCWVTRAGGQC